MSEASLVLGRTWKRPPIISNPNLRWALIIGALVYLIAAVMTIDVNWSRVYEGLERGKKFILAFSNPNFSDRWTDIQEGMLESIVMAVNRKG